MFIANYRLEFIRPDELKDPSETFIYCLRKIHAKIGSEALISKMQTIALAWARQSGYYVSFNENKLTFKHVSL